MLNFRLSKNAESHLIDIYNFSVENWGVLRGTEYIEQLEQMIMKLCIHPFLAKKRLDLGKNLYSFPIQNHVIYFLLDKEWITILAILHHTQLPKIETDMP